MYKRILIAIGLVSLILSLTYMTKRCVFPQASSSTTIQNPFVLSLNNKQLTGSYVQVGIDQFNTGTAVGQACPFEDHGLISCLEGYYFAQSLNNIKNENSQPATKDPTLLLGFGMAQAKLELTPVQNPYIIDGWSFVRFYDMNTHTESAATDMCKKSFTNNNLEKYCLWGAGRALYFTSDNDHLYLNNKYLKNGYEFAKQFAQPLNKSNKVSNELNVISLAQALKMSANSHLKAQAPSWIECAYSKHLLDCVE